MTNAPYQPPKEILEKYAQVLVNYALNGGTGLKQKEVVFLRIPDVAKELGRALRNEVLRQGGQPLLRIYPTGMEADFYELANEEQLTFFPEQYLHAQAELIDHAISIIGETDPFELLNTDPDKIMKTQVAAKPYRDWLMEKENRGAFSWTAALWGTQAGADQVGLSLEEYWQQIIQACFLDEANSVHKWQTLQKQQEKIKQQLDDMKIEKVHIVGPEVDLTIRIGADRVWRAGSGANIPSFEFFTTPHMHGTEGWIRFNQPLYRYGNVIEDIELYFEQGKVIKSNASKGQNVLQSMLAAPQADMLGEFSLTDSRMSRITHVMAETLYDENIGGPHGNMHVAVGMAYKDCYRGDPSQLGADDWNALGFNDSAVHTDIITTAERTVTASLQDGSELVLYKDGKFTFWDGK
jgi:aminopeptidase